MVVDFKALKLALETFIDRFDHSMSLNADDPMRPEMERIHPGSTISFDGVDPTTEAFARVVYEYVAGILKLGFEQGAYRIPAGTLKLERVRVGETPSSWAEYGE
jgi:6-pyruvoyltetrahydropterin/6-carboxytetrahydropterin synthase